MQHSGGSEAEKISKVTKSDFLTFQKFRIIGDSPSLTEFF